MEDNGQLGSFAPGGAFELILIRAPYCDPCSTCTTWLLPFGGLSFPVSLGPDDECAQVDGVCKVYQSFAGPPQQFSCLRDGVDCTKPCTTPLPSPSPPPLPSPSPPLLLSPSPPPSPSPVPPSPSPPPSPAPLPPPPPPSPSPVPPSPSPPPPPPPSPQQRPVECGRPGRCSEAAGLRDPDELHEARALTVPRTPVPALYMHVRLHARRAQPRLIPATAFRCGAAPTSSSLRPGDPVGLAALCGESRMRAGRAHATRPSPRPRPSAKPQARGSAPPPSWRPAAPQALAAASTSN